MRTNALETVGYQYIREDLAGAMRWAEKIAARPDAHEAMADVANEMVTAMICKLQYGQRNSRLVNVRITLQRTFTKRGPAPIPSRPVRA